MFTKAKAIWLKGLENEFNIQALFTAEFSKYESLALKITGATAYRVYINDTLVHYGPARTAGGYARIDVVPVCDCILKDKNIIRIEAVNYYCNSFAFVRQTGFLQAEIVSGDEVIAATGYDFKAYRVNSRLQKVMRYSYQRCFTEVWDTAIPDSEHEICCPDINVKYLDRHAPLPDLNEIMLDEITQIGEFGFLKEEYPHRKQRFIDSINLTVDGKTDTIMGYTLDQIEEKPMYVFDQLDYTFAEDKKSLGSAISKGKYAFFDLKKNITGMIHLKFNAKTNSKIYIVFDERLADGKINHAIWSTVNIVQLTAQGMQDFSTFEVYGFRYAAVFVMEGEIELDGFSVIEYKNPIKNPPALKCDDPLVQGIYTAAVETLRQNSVDLYTDCPTRERAGWLCDSYYSAQAEYAFTGKTDVEDDFIENYLIQTCKYIPYGMLPMCYPSDHYGGQHIPQWAMWFVLEIEQYKQRKPEFDLKRFEPIAYNLLSYLAQFENEYRLLENLPGWNFVEWSQANSWTKGVNFPTNMLYSEMLCIIGRLFNDDLLIKKAAKIRDAIVLLSYNGTFFCDQAYRNESNELITYPDRITEVCQYYAFRFRVADKENFPKLYDILLTDFYPNTTMWPDIPKVNAFIGMYVRMELLREWGKNEMLVKEIKDFFQHMAQHTGTLWEHKDMTAGSLNHGFASYVGGLLLEIFNK
ncbi:MAG: hypothetical protein E7588_09605 [Ruminococcaceae bacterium]|nr:hypothetical protein [Oscillospiraceae bacterium]